MRLRKLIFLLLLSIGCCRAVNYARFAAYDSLFSASLEQAGLPENFKYLPLLLTDCNPQFQNDYSAGLWGLSAPAAAHYGLRMTGDYDERFSPRLSTLAAVAYLTDLMNMYDTEKALNIFVKCAVQNNTIFQAAPTGKIPIKTSFLLERTAVAFQLNTQPNAAVLDNPIELTIEQNIRISDFCQNLHTDETNFRVCNPALAPKAEILRTGYRVCLPEIAKRELLSQPEKLYCNALSDSIITPNPPVSEMPAKMPEFFIYRVKSGDTLGHIAMRYHVGVSQLKRWNSLRSETLQIGQKLKIYN